MTAFIGDSATAWYDAQVAAGKSDAQIKQYLQQYDQWDRYDYDLDGIVNEPDGYIDHFQAIHAGEEEAQAPGEDTWMIWSHRWAANQDGFGVDGPTCSGCYKLGGVQIGDTGYWIRDYTTEPENGGLGVFAHEFGHDLGLPDFYDTDPGRTDDNGAGFWTLMSSGSWLSQEGAPAGRPRTTWDPRRSSSSAGTAPTTSPSWTDSRTSRSRSPWGPRPGPRPRAPGRRRRPSRRAPARGGAGRRKHRRRLPLLGRPTRLRRHGDRSGSDRDPAGRQHAHGAGRLRHPEQLRLRLPAGLQRKAHWQNVETSLSTDTNPEGQNLGHGITGDSGGHGATWQQLTADLSAYEGTEVQLRWKYVTDLYTTYTGLMVDDLEVGDYSIAFEPSSGWDLGGFHLVENGSYEAATRATTWPRTVSTVTTTPPWRPAPTAPTTPTSTSWTTSRTRTVCWSGTPTGATPTTTPAPTRVAASRCRSTPTPPTSCGSPSPVPASWPAADCRPSTRPSTSTRPMPWR